MPTPLEELQQQVAQLANEETGKNLEAAALRVLELTSVNRRCNAQILILVKALRVLLNASNAVDLNTLNAVPAHHIEVARKEVRVLLSYFAGVE